MSLEKKIKWNDTKYSVTDQHQVRIEHLNEYCQLHILQYLSTKDKLSCTKVCSKWQNFIIGLWKISKLELADFPKYAGFHKSLKITEFKEIIKHCCHNLREIVIFLDRKVHWNQTAHSPDSNLVVVFDSDIYFLNEKSVHTLLHTISKYCYNLKVVRLTSYTCVAQPIFQREFQSLLQSCSSVEEYIFEVIYNSDITILEYKMQGPQTENPIQLKPFLDLHELLNSPRPNLKKLKVLNMYSLHNIAIETLHTIQQNAKQLQVLTLQGLRDEKGAMVALRNIARLTNLEELELEMGVTIPENIITEIISSCTKLRSFSHSLQVALLQNVQVQRK